MRNSQEACSLGTDSIYTQNTCPFPLNSAIQSMLCRVLALASPEDNYCQYTFLDLIPNPMN